MNLISGFGINDADYKVQDKRTVGKIGGKQKQKVVWTCPYYAKWKSMVDRCYSERIQQKYPSYADCTVCDEWKYFSNFKAWMEQQDWEGKELDKDLLISGNKIYSPDTCCFIPKSVNLFLTTNSKNRGNYPLGVNWHKPSNKFTAFCWNPFLSKRAYLGVYECKHEAHLVWARYKLELAIKIGNTLSDKRVSFALFDRYNSLTIAAENAVKKAEEALKAAKSVLEKVKESK